MASSRYRPAPHIVSRQLDDEYFVLNLETNKLFELNATGCVIWKLVEEGLDRAEIERRLLSEFDIDADVLSRDIDQLLGELVRAGMLVEDTHVVVDKSSLARPRQALEGWLVRWTPADEQPHVFGMAVADAPFGFAALGGYVFDAPDDPARHVAEAYERSGPDFAGALRGGYAAVVWDRRQRALYVARDATGMRPCFYTWDGSSVYLSSSLDTLLALPGTNRDINRLVLAEYLHSQFPDEQKHETFYEGVHRLPAASRLTVRDGRLRVERYWEPVPDAFSWAGDEEVQELIPLLDRAVSRCVSVGGDSVALSGGYDSVSVAILAARHVREPLHALSVRLTGTSSDEGPIQSAVADTLGMRQHMIDASALLGGDDFAERALSTSAQSPSPLLGMWQWIYSALADQARDAGCRSMMMGTGGDELFGVDPRYAQDLLRAGDVLGLYQLARAWQRTSPFSAAFVAKELLWRNALRPMIRGSLRSAIPAPVRDLARRWLGRERWYFGPGPELARAMTERAQQEPHTGEIYRSLMRGVVDNAALLVDIDQATAWADRHGVSMLYPYYDRDLISLVLRCPPASLYRSGRMKAPLRDLVAGQLSNVTLPARKVDFTQAAHGVLRPSVGQLWRQLGGPKMLEELNVVRRDRIELLIERYIRGSGGGLRQVWSILAAEVWLRARNSS